MQIQIQIQKLDFEKRSRQSVGVTTRAFEGVNRRTNCTVYS